MNDDQILVLLVLSTRPRLKTSPTTAPEIVESLKMCDLQLRRFFRRKE